MRRVLMFVLMVCLLGAAAWSALAQDAPATPSPDELFALATQVAENAARVEQAVAQAERYAQDAQDAEAAAGQQMDMAFNLLGLFEGITGVAGLITGLIIPLIAVAIGASALSRLNSAQAELREARERFEADVHQKQEELLAVRRELERATAEQRDNTVRASIANSFLSLGERQYRSQDFSGAIETYRQALALDNNNLMTHYRLGYVYTQSGVLDSAQEHLTHALTIQPNFAPALAALGYVTRRIGEKMPPGTERDKVLNRAESLLLEALSLSPRLVDDDGESWWGSLGGLYRRRNQIDEAIHAYGRAAEVTPKSSYAYSNLALLYMQKRDHAAMLRTYQRVEQLAWGEVQADVDNYWAYADLFTARLALGKVKEANETLASVLDVAPKEGPYVFESLLDTLGRLEQALGPENAVHVREAAEVIGAHREKIIAQRGESQSPASA